MIPLSDDFLLSPAPQLKMILRMNGKGAARSLVVVKEEKTLGGPGSVAIRKAEQGRVDVGVAPLPLCPKPHKVTS